MSKHVSGEKNPNWRHGGYSVNRPEHNSYRAMKSRCLNPQYPYYSRYGGRGIRVCERWLRGFQYFFEDMGKKPGPKYTLERIDYDGNYDPSNCRWATQREQNNNKVNNKLVIVDGVEDTFANHARKRGIKPGTVTSRVRQQGWSVQEAFTIPSGGIGANQTSRLR